jgi:trimethylguanosine synthase
LQVFSEVLGIEISERRCSMAAHNAAVYQAQAKTHFLCCDFFQAAARLRVDAIFASPPWGGPKYQFCETFDVLASMLDGQRSIKELLVVCLETVSRSWAINRQSRDGQEGRGVVSLFLPRNTDLEQLASLVPDGTLWNVERNFVNGKLKGITLYCLDITA